MSKMDALRAMREAKYEQAAARARSAGAPAARPPAATRPAVTTAKAEPGVDAEPAAEPAAGPALCGHRNMGGRTCTREHGHAAKNHRYS